MNDKKENKVNFNSKNLTQFLSEFEPYYFKYLGRNEVSQDEKEYIDIIAEEIESNEEIIRFNIDRAYETYETADKVYCDETKASNYSYIYDLIIEKFLGKFVGIDYISDLYKPSYFGFEWMMHMEYNPKMKQFSYYRDHYIHQARNLYEMFKLLDMKYFEILKNMYENDKSFLAKNMRRAVDQECKREDIQEKICKIYKFKNKDKDKKENEVERYCREYVYRYIIYASAVVASVVHDIGYPIQYINRNLEWMEEFLPVSNYFFERKAEGQKISSMLENSLLYKMKPNGEIMKRLEKGDHGAISACILLIKFYRAGAIHSLSPAERMVIENSAIAIYEHTLHYQKLGDKKAELYQNVFRENPFSYLFRFCDDLQEWSRVYFDITKQSNFLVCKKCGTFSTKVVNNIQRKNDKIRKYTCCCSDWEGVNANLFKYRRLMHVDACNDIEIVCREDGGTQTDFCITMKYNLLSLLQAAAYNPKFAQKRAEGLKELKLMITDEYDFGHVYIDTFLTNNPVAIKTEIMRRYLKTMDRELEEREKKLEKMLGIWESALGDYKQIDKTVNLIKDHANFYMELAEYVDEIQNTTDAVLDDNDNDETKARTKTNTICAKFSVDNRIIKKLIFDCIYQAYLYVSEDSFFDGTPVDTNYFEMFYRSDDIVDTVQAYIDSDLYDEIRKACRSVKEEEPAEKKLVLDGKYDYYSDYYFFDCLIKDFEQRTDS